MGRIIRTRRNSSLHLGEAPRSGGILAKIVKSKKDLNLVICQCDGGMCRSAAIAAALSVVFNGIGSDLHIFKIKNPNILVYNVMLEVTHELGLI